ncbi:MAG: TrmH family RNA methyltransferase [Bacillota bacterium]|nr:TrmH family RNA methyltransferase [Bacillota bacterium]
MPSFLEARRDRNWALLEGFHPLKHALRFGAQVVRAVSPEPEAIHRLAESLAPDVLPWLEDHLEPIPKEIFSRQTPYPLPSPVLALAPRPPIDAGALLREEGRNAPLLLLEHPSHLGNVGAAIRVAAAAGARGVVVTGPQDPWHPAALRGAAGLQFALPVAAVAEGLPPVKGPLWALHPEGDPLESTPIPSEAMLVFGSERRGLSRDILKRAERRVAIPMTPGVSSLNLATAVAVVLYAWRLGRSL